MDFDANTAAAVTAALADAGTHADQMVGRTGDPAVIEAFAMGYLAGRVAQRSPVLTSPASEASLQPAPLLVPGSATVASFAAAAAAYEQLAERLESYVAGAEQQAEHYRAAGRGEARAAERTRAARAQETAQRARATARQLRVRAGSGAPVGPPSLTRRETEVLSLVSYGLTYAETAEQLHVSAATVKTHLAHIYPKFGVRDKAAAVAAALRHGLLH